MSIENLNRWFSLAANLGVILGIIFLAVELRQNNELLQAEARYNRLESRKEGNFEILRNRELSDAILKLQTDEELSPTEDLIVGRFRTNTILNWQYAYQEYSNGLIPIDDVPVEAWRTSMELRPDLKARWDSMKDTALSGDFVQWMKSNGVD